MLTNAHVIEGASKVVVRTQDKARFLATIVSTSVQHDLALLRISGTSPPGLPLGDASDIDVGVDVIVVGSPLGFEGTVTKGIVSGIRVVDDATFLQIDAAINPETAAAPC